MIRCIEASRRFTYPTGECGVRGGFVRFGTLEGSHEKEYVPDASTGRSKCLRVGAPCYWM